jgi:hypothetical protein
MKTRAIPAIQVTLKPSYIVLGCYLSVSILSIIALLLTQLSWIVISGIGLLIIIATIYWILQDALLRMPWSWQMVEVTSLGKLRLTNQRHETFETNVLPSSVNHPWLTVLHVKRASRQFGFRNSAMLTPWQVSNLGQYRQLRVWLKWGNHQTND